MMVKYLPRIYNCDGVIGWAGFVLPEYENWDYTTAKYEPPPNSIPLDRAVYLASDIDPLLKGLMWTREQVRALLLERWRQGSHVSDFEYTQYSITEVINLITELQALVPPGAAGEGT